MAKKTTKKSTVKKTIKRAPKKKIAVNKSSAKKAAPKKKTTPKKKAVAKPKPIHKTVSAKPPTKPKSAPKKKCKALPIIGLLVNIAILPGLGTLIGDFKKRTRNGVIQLILSIVAWALILTFVGIVIGVPLLFAMWVWSIVDMGKAIGER